VQPANTNTIKITLVSQNAVPETVDTKESKNGRKSLIQNRLYHQVVVGIIHEWKKSKHLIEA
jgi:hypothetical protein